MSVIIGVACALAILGGGWLGLRDMRREQQRNLGDDALTLVCARCNGNPHFACTCTGPCGRRYCPEEIAARILGRTDLDGELAALLGDANA